MRVTWRVSLLVLGVAVMFGGAVAAADEEERPSEFTDDGKYDPAGMLLTWQQDPLTTMTIDWNTYEDRETAVQYRQAGDWEFSEATGETHAFPFSERTIHRVELTGLEPGTRYEFRLGDDSVTYAFRTMPENIVDQPVRFAAGGDTRHNQEWMENTNAQAARFDVDFVTWGGDLAYADGREDRLYRWEEWFEAMKQLVTKDGRVIPVLAGIGNHEVVNGYYYNHDDYEQTDEWRADIAPYFFALFAFPGQPGYGAMDFGDYLSIVLLDSDHANPIEGEQTEWLEQALQERQDVPHVFPNYHVPAYPSHRSYDGGVQTRVREQWVPLFDEYGVRVAFENHDHTYKRTHPIRGGEIAKDGIVYLGDGAWGVGTRSGDSQDEWYMNKFASVRHAIIATIHGPHQHFLVISEDGDIVDEYPETSFREIYGLE